MELNTKFWLEKQKESNSLEDLEGEVTVKRKILKIGLEGENWTHLAQYTDRWLAFLTTVMKSRFL